MLRHPLRLTPVRRNAINVHLVGTGVAAHEVDPVAIGRPNGKVAMYIGSGTDKDLAIIAGAAGNKVSYEYGIAGCALVVHEALAVGRPRHGDAGNKITRSASSDGHQP